MPEIARKIGKIMAEFRGTAAEFKETWQKEVDFEEEAKSLDLNSIEAEASSVPRVKSISPSETVDMPQPAIREVDPADLERLKEKAALADTSVSDEVSGDNGLADEPSAA